MGIDKIALISKGVFIVRFHSFGSKAKVLLDGIPMFDKKTRYCSTLDYRSGCETNRCIEGSDLGEIVGSRFEVLGSRYSHEIGCIIGEIHQNGSCHCHERITELCKSVGGGID